MFLPLISSSFDKITNAQSVQINATDRERRFQTQNRNNSTVENNAYKDKRKKILHWVRLSAKDFGMKKHSNTRTQKTNQ